VLGPGNDAKELDAAEPSLREAVMAVLWFVHAVEMYGYPVYRCAASDLVRKFGGATSFKFLGRLDQTPERARPHNHDHVASYDRVLLELADVEARSVRWRSGFYEVQHSRKEVIDILGEPNLPADDAVTGHNRDGTYGLDP
jgi:hypothetical protein